MSRFGGGIGLSIIAVCLLASANAGAWLVTIPDGDPSASGFRDDVGTSVLIDGAGDVVAGGWLSGPSGGYSPFLVGLDGATGSERWRVGFDGVAGPSGFQQCSNISYTELAFDPANGVYASGRFCPTAMGGEQFGVTKVSNANGAAAWTTIVSAPPFEGGVGVGVATMATGDVVAAGTRGAGNVSNFTVAALDAGSGAYLWQRDLTGADSPDSFDSVSAAAYDVAVDASGDVVAAGYLEQATGSGFTTAFTVAKFDGTTGVDAWAAPVLVEIPAVGTDVAVDAGGDVFAAGWAPQLALEMLVVKLDGGDGSELWRAAVTIPTAAYAVPSALRVDGAGDVLVAGDVGLNASPRSTIVAKLSGSTGAELWRFDSGPGSDSTSFGGRGALTVDPSNGTSLLAATRFDADTGGDIALYRLDPTTGALLRSYQVNGYSDGGSGVDVVGAVATGPDGQLVVAGGVVDREDDFDGQDFAVLDFAERLPGTALIVRDAGAGSKLRFKAKVRGVLAVTPGTPGDPRQGGATLELRNPITAETATFPLPAALWRSRTDPAPGAQMYKYGDPTSSAGPCKSVTIKSGAVLKAVCKDSLGGFTLDESSQGSLEVRLSTGAQSAVYCTRFTAPIDDEPGTFHAAASPPPASCD